MTFNNADRVYELPALPFGSATLPGISRTTLEFHHERHHRAYVAKLNVLIADSPLRGRSLEDLVKESEGALFNNAAQAWNHGFYWNCLTPEPNLSPRGDLATWIERDFGSLDRLLERFRASALAKFGSGYAWLLHDGSGLAITSTPNQDNPILEGHTPLLGLDVWEHAYYLDYQNRRPDYIDAWFNVVNWETVAQRYADATAPAGATAS